MTNITDIASANKRIDELLRYNNDQVEKRRAATKLLREAADMFRFYERSHRAKADAMQPAGLINAARASRLEKAERNAAIAARIEVFLDGIHQ